MACPTKARIFILADEGFLHNGADTRRATGFHLYVARPKAVSQYIL